jgi:branched-chain amino acid transport system ATP-binding protein
MALLSVRDETMLFGGLFANQSISFDVEEGELLAVIGPNGAGKTTLFNVISGVFPPTSGSIHFDSEDITGAPPHRVASTGLIRTYQLVQLFKHLTAAENVEIGSHRVTRGGVFSALFRPDWMRRQEKSVSEGAHELLRIVGLENQAETLADKLPYGRQRLLEIARALAARPRLLLLDEPAAGLNTYETEALAEVITRIHRTGTTIILIEHDMSLVMKIAQRIVVLDFGKKIAEGTPEAIKAHPDVIAAYLGGTEMADAQ